MRKCRFGVHFRLSAGPDKPDASSLQPNSGSKEPGSRSLALELPGRICEAASRGQLIFPESGMPFLAFGTPGRPAFRRAGRQGHVNPVYLRPLSAPGRQTVCHKFLSMREFRRSGHSPGRLGQARRRSGPQRWHRGCLNNGAGDQNEMLYQRRLTARAGSGPAARCR